MITEVQTQKGELLKGLNGALRGATYQDYILMQRLMSGERTGGENAQGLSDCRLYYLGPILYCSAHGSGKYDLDEIVKASFALKVSGNDLNTNHVKYILKWAERDAGIFSIRWDFTGSRHPHEPTGANVDINPYLLKFSEKFLSALYGAFKDASHEELTAFEKILRETGTIDRYDASRDYLDSLRYRPFWYWRLLAYFRSNGSRSYTLGEAEQEVIVRGPESRALMGHHDIKTFLFYAKQKNIFTVEFSAPKREEHDRETSFHVDTTPLSRWKL